MQRKFNFASEEYFHIYNRGTDKRNIFNNKNDCERFMESLYLFNSEDRVVLKVIPKKERFYHERDETIVDIGSYCLMPNHFHLLIRAKNDFGVSSFMEKIQTSHSMYFNKRYDRTGSLFEGPFKAIHVTRDEYLKYLFSYIHLNPIKIIEPKWKEKGIQDLEKSKTFLNSYKYSSYQDYLGVKRVESVILNKTVFPEYFKSSKDFDQFINFWLTSKDFEEEFKIL